MMRFSSSYLVVGCLVQLAYSDQAWHPLLIRDVSTGHLGNCLEAQQTEGREKISCGKFVFYGCIFYREYVAYFGTGIFAFPNS
jgi:hypothetical protein